MPTKTKSGQLRRHMVVYHWESMETECVVMAMLGFTTKAIARETGLSPSQVQYRISKSQHAERCRYRQDYRDMGGFATHVLRAFQTQARQHVERVVYPVFKPFSRF